MPANNPLSHSSSRGFVAASLLTASLALNACGAPAGAQPSEQDSWDHAFRLVPLVEGLEHPWALAFLPDGRKLVTERPGRLRVIDQEHRMDPEPVPGVPEVVAQGQGGLLDIALHPDFEENGWVYFTLAGRDGQSITTQLARARFDGDALQDTAILFSAETEGSGGRHFGSRIVFDRKGDLWMTVGERGSADEAQNLANHNGTLLRLHDDGSVPADNPFVDEPDALPEIWSYGHRNAQGMTLHPDTGRVWLHEHGPRGGDEINLPEAGLNYGWPITTHGTAYSGLPMGVGPEAPGMEPPLLHWTPSIAPSGMAFYTGEDFPAWQGDIFVGALALPQLQHVILDGSEITGEETLLGDWGQRIRDVRMGPDGYLYLLTDASQGALLRLEPIEE